MTTETAKPKVTSHRAATWLTGDLKVEWSVFDHHASEVPDEAWQVFRAGYRHAHGSELPGTIAEYVTDSAWIWDDTYTDGTLVIGDKDSPLAVDLQADDARGRAVTFWHEGSGYDTGLRVWDDEAAIVTKLLREKTENDRA